MQLTNDVLPTLQPEAESATKAVPLDEQAISFGQQPTPPAATRTFPPTTPVTHTQPLLPANTANQVDHLNKHIDYDAVKEQEKDPLKITPEMANKLLHMIQEKGNQFEMTHKAAAEKMQRNISAPGAPEHEAPTLQDKLTSPVAPQPPLSVKNTTALQPPTSQQSIVQPAASQQPAAPAHPVKPQQLKPVQTFSETGKGGAVSLIGYCIKF